MLEKAEEFGLSLTNLKLHKLLYLAHGLMLAKYDRPLLEGEPFAAWKYGPVVESLYHDLKVFGASKINADSSFISNWKSLDGETDEVTAIAAILKQFGTKSAGALIDTTHRSDGPWHAVFEENTPNVKIDDDEIKNYFKKHLKK